MIALYHLFSGTPLARLPQEVQDLVRSHGGTELPNVRRAVLVGTKISPGQPAVKADGTEVGTLWGELAWQLGGAEGFAVVAEADRTRTNPGDALRVLLAAHAALHDPDRRVGRVRPWQLYADDTLPGGTFDTHFSFAQALTEACASARRVAGRLDPCLRDRRTARPSARTSRLGAPAVVRRCGDCAWSSGAWNRRGGPRRPTRASRSCAADCSNRST